MGCLICPCLLIFLSLSQINYASSFSSNSSSSQLCPHDQSFALLHFKSNFSFNKSASDVYYGIGNCPHSYPKMHSWEEGTDCCSWDGVTCHRVTGHVIGLDLSSSWLQGTIYSNSTLFLLTDLQSLNLASNNLYPSPISSQFGRFTKLTHLNLSSSMFHGQIPSEISYLSQLVSLDLSYNYRDIYGDDSRLRLDTPDLKRLVQNLTALKQLNLGGVNMSWIELDSLRNLSSSLTSLNLRNCGLRGKFSDVIFRRTNLQKLDLSLNRNLTGYFPKVNRSNPLESLVLQSLNYLDLSYTSFLVLESIGNLQSLKYLDLSHMSFSGELPHSIGNLRSLKYFDLSHMSFSGKLPHSIGNLRSLKYLYLSSTSFSGELPHSIGNLWSMKSLFLSSTIFSGELPHSIGNLQSLKSLDLSNANFSGKVPVSIDNLKSLNYLDLYNCNFFGSIPTSLRNLTQIIRLDLSNNNFFGEIPSSLSNLTRLHVLDLSRNQLVGRIPTLVCPNLIKLRLSYNLLTGTIPYWGFTLPSLMSLDLSHNQLTGTIPWLIFQPMNLTYLSLSSNNLSGVVEVDKFSMLKNLEYLYISFNSLSLSINKNFNSTLPQFLGLGLASCNLSEFPNLRTQGKLISLDLSKNKIYSEIPNWALDMWKDSLGYLNLASNFMTGAVKLSWEGLQILDLHSNLFEGPLPNPAPFTRVFLISDNKFTGEIPHSICNLSSLQILDFSNNNLSGIIPMCLGNFSNQLSVLDLRTNRLNGTIPRTFAKGNGLRNIDLNGNQLEGPIPPSLIHCRNLEILDLGDNKIKDTFPHWLETLPKLQVLVLRSNRFHSPIKNSKAKQPFPKLRIFDLSYNDFSGPLPTRYIQNLKAMMKVTEDKGEPNYMGGAYYQDSVRVTLKGVEIVMQRILTVFTTIDLSCNRFHGEIPKSIGKLSSLRGLNFSHNNLTGPIPPSLENLRKLEALDLSWNNINGNIPEQLTSLTFLAFLNLSQNHLVGRIPQGKQFNTFANDSYIGNQGLCGVPLLKKCSNDEALQPPPSSIFREDDNHESASGFGWKAVAMGYGCGMVLGLAMGCLMLSTGKLEWLVRLVEGKNLKKARRVDKSFRRREGRRN